MNFCYLLWLCIWFCSSIFAIYKVKGLIKYQQDLFNIDETHPGLREMHDQGVFTAQRTEQDFSIVPVDLTLKQIINVAASFQLTGINSFTNDYSAHIRWMVTKVTRALSVS